MSGTTCQALLEAARAFYNGTVADPEVKIRCTDAHKRDHVTRLASELRAAIAAALESTT